MTAPAEQTARGKILAPYLALAALWLLTLTIVPPRGNFPLNDDWMYAKVVQHLVDTGEYQASPYADPTFILQAYWGAAFAKLFGFSFETLRISTLVLALVAIWAAHWAAREAGLSARWAFLVALTLLVNPLFLNLSYTFMTDVPFLALSLLTGAAYLRAIRTECSRWILAATAIFICALFVRQFAVVLLIAACPIFISAPTTGSAKRLIRKLAAFIPPLLVAAIFYIMLPIGGLSAADGWDWNRLGGSCFARAMEIVRHLVFAFTYLAFLSIPIFAGLSISKPKDGNFWKKLLPLAMLSLVLFGLAYPHWPHRLPNVGNLLYDFGVGPLLLPGMIENDAITAPVRIGTAAWWVFTAIATVGAAAFIVVLARAGFRFPSILRGDTEARSDLFLALWAVGLLLVLIMPPVLARFDRYFLMAQIPAVILITRRIATLNVQPSRAAYAVAGACWVVSIVCLQDYLAWNTARSNALYALHTEHGASLEQINGGYEFNGWVHSQYYESESIRTGIKNFGPKGWWIRGDDFRVSIRPNKHFEIIGTEPYFSWLGFEKREMLLLRRTEPDPAF